MKVFKVPRPDNYYEFASNEFPTTVPLIASSRSGASDPYGYWIFCSNTDEEKAIIAALGLDYSIYEKAKSALTSATEYQPPVNTPTKKERDERQAELCSSSLNKDKALCTLYKMAPESQSPIICPSALAKIDGGYDLSIYTTGVKNVAAYNSGLVNLPPMDLGCLEIKQALKPKDQPDFPEIRVTDAEMPSPATDLNCLRGTPQESFISICSDARAGKSREDLFTLNALTSRLDVPAELPCDTLKDKINTKISELKEKALDLSKAGITSLKLLRYLPATANVKIIYLNDNENLGTNDTATKGVLDDLQSFIGLNEIRLKGTKVGNLHGLRDLQFLQENNGNKAVDVAWSNIFPESCSTSAISEPLRKACDRLQVPIDLKRDNNGGSGTLLVGKLVDSEVRVKASHYYQDLLDSSGFQFTSRSDCRRVTQDGNLFSLQETPTPTCTLNIDVKGGRLKPSTISITYKFRGFCEGNHWADEEWFDHKDDYTRKFKCERYADTVRTIWTGVCDSKDKWFDLQSQSCKLKICDGGKEVGMEWPVDTNDGLGKFKNRCVVHTVDPVIEYKPDSGSCNDPAKYDFVFNEQANTKACVLKRCELGFNLGDERPKDLPNGKGSYKEICQLTNGQATISTKTNSGSCTSTQDDFNYQTLSCVVARCSNGLAIGATGPQLDTFDGRGSYVEECKLSADGATASMQFKAGSCQSSSEIFVPASKSCVCGSKRELPADYFKDYKIKPTSTKPGSGFTGTIAVKNWDGKDSTQAVTTESFLEVFTDKVSITVSSRSWRYFGDDPNVRAFNIAAMEGKIPVLYYNVTESVKTDGDYKTNHNKDFVEYYTQLGCGQTLYKTGPWTDYFHMKDGSPVNAPIGDEDFVYVSPLVTVKTIDCSNRNQLTQAGLTYDVLRYVCRWN